MAAETGFLIDGKLHPLPTRDSFDFDEWQVVWDYSRLSLEDFLGDDEESAEADERAEKFRNPAFLRSLMHIAYQRANPTLSADKVKALVGKVNMIEALSGLVGEDEDEGDDAGPLALTKPPDDPSPSGTDSTLSPDSTSDPSTPDSTNVSDEPESPPASTTQLRSATSSISHQEISAA